MEHFELHFFLLEGSFASLDFSFYKTLNDNVDRN